MSTDRLTIRFYEDRDKDLELAIHGDSGLFTHLPIDPGTSVEINESLSKRVGQHSLDEVGATVSLAIELSSDETYVGGMQLTPIQLDPLQISIGWVALGARQGHGYMTEAVSAVIDSLFTGSDVHRIVADIIEGNHASVRLAERLGFRKEAHFVKSLRLRSQWRDETVYALLEEDRVT